jgi:hypothetical protein
VVQTARLAVFVPQDHTDGPLFLVIGEVAEVGTVCRVVSQACGINEAFNDFVKGDFQLHTVLVNYMAAPIPPTIAVGSRQPSCRSQ